MSVRAEAPYALRVRPRYPNFFIVGAPRCASTFLYTYLREHPDIFMPAEKEPKYFCADLDSGSAADGDFFIRDEQRYLALFAAAGEERRIGEACVFNLYSTVAAERIRQKSPEAQIIIMLRDPVEQMYSYHAMRRRNATEDLEFEEALAAEADRREGRRLPRLARNLKMYQYRAVASYAEQVARYFDTFGRANVQVIIYEDLVRDPAASFRATLEFLGVDPDFAPVLKVVNPHRENLMPRMNTLLRDKSLVDWTRRITPRPLRRPAGALRRRMSTMNLRRTGRSPVDPRLAARLRSEVGPDVNRLSKLIGRDMSTIW